MKWHERRGPLRKHRMKGTWKRLSDEDLAAIDAPVKRYGQQQRPGTAYSHRKTA